MPISNTTIETGVDSVSLSKQPLWRTVLGGTLLAGTLDISAAIITWMSRDVPAMRVLQGVAAGLLGREARNGGWATAMLGLALHYLIMSVIVATFFFASRRLPKLVQRWLPAGMAYGVAVYIVMTFIVVPLSAFPGNPIPPWSQIVQGVIVHMFCVGVPIAWVTSRLARGGYSTPG
ncbi:MAG TPA: hypothetical protein VF161_13065 [Steroidobacteraceae bacterium]|jgi:hypothetical protein